MKRDDTSEENTSTGGGGGGRGGSGESKNPKPWDDDLSFEEEKSRNVGLVAIDESFGSSSSTHQSRAHRKQIRTHRTVGITLDSTVH